MTDRTPKPWVADMEAGTGYWGVWNNDLKNGAPVVISKDLSEADARFIAVAPDMLDALELVVAGSSGLSDMVIAAIRGVIARAKMGGTKE